MGGTEGLREAVARALCQMDCDARGSGSPCGNTCDSWRDFDPSAVLKAITDSGYAIVPVEPSEEMIHNGATVLSHPSVYMGGPPAESKRKAAAAYRAMIAGGGAMMPIRPENRDRYPDNWSEIRAHILKRATDPKDGVQKCEKCRAPNGEIVARNVDGSDYMLPHGDVFDAETGEHLGVARGSEYPGGKMVRIVLTIAHLDHTPENNEDDNLRAWCQRCHNRYDAPMRRKGVVERKRLPLFDEAVTC